MAGSEPQGILVGERTYALGQTELDFDVLEKIKVKGKTALIPIFRPRRKAPKKVLGTNIYFFRAFLLVFLLEPTARTRTRLFPERSRTRTSRSTRILKLVHYLHLMCLRQKKKQQA